MDNTPFYEGSIREMQVRVLQVRIFFINDNDKGNTMEINEKKKTSPLAMGCSVFIIIFVMIAFLGSENIGGSDTSSALQVAKRGIPISNISFSELDAIYNVSSKRTDLQKDSLWKNYKGKRVTWTGEVSHVDESLFGGLQLQIKMKRSTFTSDLIIDLRENQESKALQVSIGQQISFTGTLDSWGAILPIGMIDGVIN